jgi:hypothetical protein
MAHPAQEETITLVKEIFRTYLKERNQRQIGVEWHFTTADARTKLKRLYPSPS